MIADQVIGEWRLCRDWLLPALRDHTEAQILRELMAGRAQLWRGDRAAMVTQLINGEHRYGHGLLGGGDLRELVLLAPGMCAWARAQGADFATINGRAGWARALARYGFERRPDGELWKDLR